MRLVTSAAVCASALGWGSIASADPQAEAPEGPAYRLSAELDIPAILVPATVSSAWLLSSELAPPHCAPRCDPEVVNFIDRPAAGLYSKPWSTATHASNAGLLVAMPLLLALGEGPGRALNDVVVVAEATLFASATQVALSLATSRPRPRLYGDKAPPDARDDGNAARSFFSGHTATSVAVTLATFRTLQRVNRPAAAWTALGLGLAGSAFISVGRVLAGSHFPTDVAAGAAVGAAYGLAVPALHPLFAEAAHRARLAPGRVRIVPFAGGGASGATLAGGF